jgi:hypothetical protein
VRKPARYPARLRGSLRSFVMRFKSCQCGHGHVVVITRRPVQCFPDDGRKSHSTFIHYTSSLPLLLQGQRLASLLPYAIRQPNIQDIIKPTQHRTAKNARRKWNESPSMYPQAQNSPLQTHHNGKSQHKIRCQPTQNTRYWTRLPSSTSIQH